VKVSLNIDRIVVDGAGLTRRERAHLAETLGRELVRLVRDRPEPGAAAPGGPDASSLGTQIARALLTALPAGVLGPSGSGHPPAPGRRGLLLPGRLQ
jgi:hypothetical protein